MDLQENFRRLERGDLSLRESKTVEAFILRVQLRQIDLKEPTTDTYFREAVLTNGLRDGCRHGVIWVCSGSSYGSVPPFPYR
jgi:hypothetical protein